MAFVGAGDADGAVGEVAGAAAIGLAWQALESGALTLAAGWQNAVGGSERGADAVA